MNFAKLIRTPFLTEQLRTTASVLRRFFNKPKYNRIFQKKVFFENILFVYIYKYIYMYIDIDIDINIDIDR